MESKLSFSNINYSESLSLQLMELWNHEVGFIFPFYKELFLQKSINCKFYFDEGSFVCFDNDKVVGFVISKLYDNNPVMSKYTDKGWISLLYVSRNYRKQGIGSKLLELAEDKFRKKNVKGILFGSDYNNFFPGIPNDFDNLTEGFLSKRGYNCGRYTHDLLKDLNNVDDLKEFDLSSYNLKYASFNDKEKVLDFFKKCFYGRWYYEALEYFNDGDIQGEYLICLEDDKVVGFLRLNKNKIKKISYNENWNKRFDTLVGVGPLGVDPDYRKNGIAKALIFKGLIDSHNEGIKNAMIDWTGLMAIYQKYGFEVWKCYQYASKDF